VPVDYRRPYRALTQVYAESRFPSLMPPAPMARRLQVPEPVPLGWLRGPASGAQRRRRWRTQPREWPEHCGIMIVNTTQTGLLKRLPEIKPLVNEKETKHGDGHP